MRRSLNEQIEISLSKVMERFLLLHTDAETVVEIVRNGLAFMGSNNIDEKIKLLNSTLSLFSEELLEAMVSGGTEYSPTATAWIWQPPFTSTLRTFLYENSALKNESHS